MDIFIAIFQRLRWGRGLQTDTKRFFDASLVLGLFSLIVLGILASQSRSFYGEFARNYTVEHAVAGTILTIVIVVVMYFLGAVVADLIRIAWYRQDDDIVKFRKYKILYYTNLVIYLILGTLEVVADRVGVQERSHNLATTELVADNVPKLREMKKDEVRLLNTLIADVSNCNSNVCQGLGFYKVDPAYAEYAFSSKYAGKRIGWYTDHPANKNFELNKKFGKNLIKDINREIDDVVASYDRDIAIAQSNYDTGNANYERTYMIHTRAGYIVIGGYLLVLLIQVVQDKASDDLRAEAKKLKAAYEKKIAEAAKKKSGPPTPPSPPSKPTFGGGNFPKTPGT